MVSGLGIVEAIVVVTFVILLFVWLGMISGALLSKTWFWGLGLSVLAVGAGAFLLYKHDEFRAGKNLLGEKNE